MVAPGHLLRQGDVVTLALDRSVRVLRVDDSSKLPLDYSETGRQYLLGLRYKF